ncbi:MAG: EamA family transporter [Anaerolineae bacterium]|nr:EamA family transporter [Anaerolineae bacterium]
MSSFIFIFFSIVFNILSQFAFKHGMTGARQAQGGAIRYMATSPWVMGGLVVYGCGTLCWIIALSRLELSFAYPFSMLSYVGIVIGSYLLFKEQISRVRLIGIAVVLLGLLVISQS